jgi:hypothetical protein
MSAATQTKIFGIRLGIDPKILVSGLVALAAILFWYNSRSDEGASAPASTGTRPAEVTPAVQTPAPAAKSRTPVVRRGNNLSNDRGRLRLLPTIDATRGDIDPTLRLDLLSRLGAVKFEPARRSVFELGAAAGPEASSLASLKDRPIIPPKPLSPPQYPPLSTAPPPANIPLKYYGFVKPMEPGQTNRGFFMDGDNVLVANEGQVLKQRYLVVELSPTTAKMEDIQVKQGQTLPLVPAALQQ